MKWLWSNESEYDTKIRNISGPTGGIDVVLVEPSEQQILSFFLFLPWIRRYHVLQPLATDKILNGMTNDNRVVLVTQPFHEYALFAPYLAEFFLMVRHWTPTQFLFPYHFVMDGKPVVRTSHQQDLMCFSRIGFNQGFFYLQKEASNSLRNYENKALERAVLHHKLSFTTEPLPQHDNGSAQHLMKIVEPFACKVTKWRIVLYEEPKHFVFYTNTLYVCLVNLSLQERLQFLKRVIAQKCACVNANDLDREDSSKSCVTLVKRIREIVGIQTVDVYGKESVFADQFASVLDTKLQPIPKPEKHALYEMMEDL